MKVKIILLIIIIMAGFVRIINLDNFPQGLNADEAAIGYNAYSLLQTGMDEHGNVWPLNFKSFGDYKPGGYFYLVLPFVKLMGLTEMAVRLPSALCGVLAVFLIFLLVKELFKNEYLALIASLFLTFSPWHIHFSRGGWEANLATTLLLLGAWLFVKGASNNKYYLFSALSFIFSMYSYHSARVIAPLLGIVLVFSYFGETKAFIKTKMFKITFILSLIILIPLIYSFASPALSSRFSGVGFTADSGPLWRINELRGQHASWNSISVVFFHNKIVAYGTSLLTKYFDHFQGNFLFIVGDVIQRNRIPEFGQMYLFDILFFFSGLYFFLKNRPKNWGVIFLWLAIAPAASALTYQTPNAIRANNMVIPLIIISAYGCYSLWFLIKENFPKILLITYSLLLITFMFWNISRYFHQYFIHYPKTYPSAWEYGFKDLVNYLGPIEKDYDKIYVTDKYDQPYILFLFYLKYPPSQFQEEVVLTPRDFYGFATVKDFGKYHFDAIDWNLLKDESNVLVVGTSEEIPKDAHIIKTIYLPNGKPAFEVAKL
jgi:4-amino-4-deoxy-L-arabinose transferase-like glycosyltransferase